MNQDHIKLNGIIFDHDRASMQMANLDIMRIKMVQQFADWSRCSLSLLGKIKIIKSFGISQYFYTIALINLATEHWKEIHQEMNTFLWNKNYNA
jgi:hypothetical protein